MFINPRSPNVGPCKGLTKMHPATAVLLAGDLNARVGTQKRDQKMGWANLAAS